MRPSPGQLGRVGPQAEAQGDSTALMFLDRRPRERRFLEWKVGLFSLAAALTLVGMYLEARWMTGLAIVVLASALLLRFLPGGGAVEEDGDDADETEDEAGG